MDLKKIFKQTGWQLLSKAITSLSTFFILAAVVKTYGEEGTGIFTLALTFLGFIYLANDLGINAYLMPGLVSDSKTLIWQKLLGLRLILCFLLLIVVNTAVIFWPIALNFKEAIRIGSLAVFGSAFFVTSSAIFQSKSRYDLSAYAQIAGAIVTTTVILGIVFIKAPLPYLMFGHLAGWIVCGLTACFLIKKIVSFCPVIDFSFIGSVFKEAWPVSATLLINILYFRFDSFILASYYSFSEVGVYNLSYQIFQTALVLPTYLQNSYYPGLISQMELGLFHFRRTLLRVVFFVALIALIGTAGVFLFSGSVIDLLTSGTGFKESASLLNILSLSFPAFFITSALMSAMIVIKKYKVMLLVYAVGIVANISFNFILIPRYSFYAAAWVTVLSEYLILILQTVILAKYFLSKR